MCLDLTKQLTAAVLACLALALPAAGQEKAGVKSLAKAPDISYTISVDAGNRYLYRGFAYSAGPVLQPSITMTHKGLTLYLWQNIDMRDEVEVVNDAGGQRVVHRGQFNETDAGLYYTIERGRLSIEPSLFYYSYSHHRGWAPTTEPALSLTYKMGPWSVSTYQAGDGAAGKWSYWGDLGFGHEKELNSRLSVRNKLAFALVAPHSAAYDLSLKLGLGDGAYIGPRVGGSLILHDDLGRSFRHGLFSFGVVSGVEY